MLTLAVAMGDVKLLACGRSVNLAPMKNAGVPGKSHAGEQTSIWNAFIGCVPL